MTSLKSERKEKKKDSTILNNDLKMNLIEQLQQTPKWKEFEEWYSKQDFYLPLYNFGIFDRGFVRYEIAFQKGVFEKFIESQGYFIEQYQKNPSINLMWAILFKQGPNTYGLFRGTFEELLIWYFNN